MRCWWNQLRCTRTSSDNDQNGEHCSHFHPAYSWSIRIHWITLTALICSRFALNEKQNDRHPRRAGRSWSKKRRRSPSLTWRKVLCTYVKSLPTNNFQLLIRVSSMTSNRSWKNDPKQSEKNHSGFQLCSLVYFSALFDTFSHAFALSRTNRLSLSCESVPMRKG